MSQRIRAYGDRHGDGMVQMSFTLAVSPSPKAREAAKQYAEKHGLKEPIVATMEECAKGFCFFVVYGNSQAEIDATLVMYFCEKTFRIRRNCLQSVGMYIERRD